MNIKKIAITLLVTVLFCQSAFGQINNNVKSNLFLFEKTTIENHSGNIFIFFTEASIKGKVDGDIYILFSSLSLVDAYVDGTIFTIISKLSCNEGSGYSMNYNIPYWLFLSLKFLFNMACYFIILALKKAFIEQGGLLLKHQLTSAIYNGLIGYFACLATAVVFLMSIAGIPFAAIGLLVIMAICIVGQTQISLALGSFMFKKSSAKKTTELNLLLGAILLEMLKLIPYLSVVLYVFIIPALSLGVVFTAIINWHFKKVFY